MDIWKGIILNNKNNNNKSVISEIYSISDFQLDKSTSKTLGKSILLYDNTSYTTNVYELILKDFEHQGMKILYIQAEDLLRKLTSYLENFFTTEGFHNLFSQFDCLLIDDSHILQNRFATQQEIAELISKLLRVGVSVIIKSSKKLNAIEQVVSKKYFLE